MGMEKKTQELMGIIEKGEYPEDPNTMRIITLVSDIIKCLSTQVLNLSTVNNTLNDLNDLRNNFIIRLKNDLDFTNEKQKEEIRKINTLEIVHLLHCFQLIQEEEDEN